MRIAHSISNLNGDNKVARERSPDQTKGEIEKLEGVAYCALLKWQKKHLYSSFVAWSEGNRNAECSTESELE